MADQSKKPSRKPPKAKQHKPKMSQAEQQKRLNKIVEMRHLYEETWRVIADEVKMTPRACQLAFAQWQRGEREALLSEDMLDVVQRKLDSIKHARQGLMQAMDAGLQPQTCKECGKECGHTARPGVVVGAARAMLEADVADLHSRQIVGLMPRNMADLRGLVDARRIMQTVAQVLIANTRKPVAEKVLRGIRAEMEQSMPLVLLPGAAGQVVEEPLELEA